MTDAESGCSEVVADKERHQKAECHQGYWQQFNSNDDQD